jgi:ribosome maturation factor RimP
MAEIEKIRALAERVASSHSLEIVEVEFRGGAGKQRMLRVFIEKNAEARKQAAVLVESGSAPVGEHLSGVTHDDCSAFSLEFGTVLDVEELIPGSMYTLEVSSPGLDRKLTTAADFERFTGSLIKVATREPIRGNQHWLGRLESFAAGKLQVRIENAKKSKGKGKAGKGKKQEEKHPEPEQDNVVTIELGNVERANLVPEI